MDWFSETVGHAMKTENLSLSLLSFILELRYVGNLVLTLYEWLVMCVCIDCIAVRCAHVTFAPLHLRRLTMAKRSATHVRSRP